MPCCGLVHVLPSGPDLMMALDHPRRDQAANGVHRDMAEVKLGGLFSGRHLLQKQTAAVLTEHDQCQGIMALQKHLSLVTSGDLVLPTITGAVVPTSSQKARCDKKRKTRKSVFF